VKQKRNNINDIFKPIFYNQRTGLFLLLLFFSISLFAYNIKVEIANCPDYYIFLGKHRGPDFEVIDSVPAVNGVAIFTGDNNLQHGVYFIVIPPQTRFDFILADEQNITIKTDARDVTGKLQISGEKQYQRFASLQKDIALLNKLRSQLNMEAEFFKNFKPDTVKYVQLKIDSLNMLQANLYKSYRLQTKRDEFLYKMLEMLDPINIPDSIEALRYSDPEKHYNYYKNHWFDRVDFDDSSILNTPEFAFHKLLEDYCFYFLDTRINNPDIVYPDIDSLVKLSQKNKEFNQYILSYLISRYENPKDLRVEAFLVYIYRNYFMVKKPEWVEDYAFAVMKFRIESIQHNVIGNIAPDLNLPDYEGNYHSIYNMHGKYKILLFWEPDCDICNETALILSGNYSKLKNLNAEVYAVLSDSENNEWQEFIIENGLDWINVYDPENSSNFEMLYGTYKTPRLYILDENNIILTKDIKPETVYDFITKYESRIKSEKERFNFIFGN
jgi:peroxiredoxin